MSNNEKALFVVVSVDLLIIIFLSYFCFVLFVVIVVDTIIIIVCTYQLCTYAYAWCMYI